MMLKLVLLIGAVSIFAFRTIVFLIGIVRERKKKIRPGAGYEPFVSVVIPARNEEDNITACIRSIAKSRYPKDKFEIIVVNDRSTDRTGDILKELEEVNENLVIKTVTEETAEPNLRGKPGALQAGIDIARGELVLMTDADCTVPEEWIMDMASAYDDEDTGLVAAFSIPEPVRVFDKVQAVYWIYLHAMGSGGFGLNMPLGCIGNNLSVRTKTFREIGGYREIKFSVTEDMSLLQAVVKKGESVRYLSLPGTTVVTKPSPGLSDFLRQMHRWSIGGLELGWKAVIFVISSIALWIGIIAAAAFWEPLWLIGIFLLRLVGDFILIAPAFMSIKYKRLIKWIFPAVLFFTFLELIVPFQLMNKKVKWKGQVFHGKKN